MKVWCVVPAAGVGARMCSTLPKAYLPIAGKKLIEITLNTLLTVSAIEKIVVVVSEQDQHWSQLALAQHAQIITVIGGEERYHSVFNGLMQLQPFAQPHDWVLVHDVARPCITPADIQHLIHQCDNHPVGGLLARPMTDTVKCRQEKTLQVENTLDRQLLWAALTPQCFRFELLKTALQQVIVHNKKVTDESHAVELLGHHPLLIEGDARNIKVTYPSDLALAENILAGVL